MVLIDTTIWSLALRHNHPKKPKELKVQNELKELIKEARATLVGPILQEVLSGIKHGVQFEKAKSIIKAFYTTDILPEDYVKAAEMYNICRRKGIQGSQVDYLLCAVSVRLNIPIFTLDKDFAHYSKHINLKLYSIRDNISH